MTPLIAELIDRSDPRDPIARQFMPDARELMGQPGERADPIGDDAFAPSPASFTAIPTASCSKSSMSARCIAGFVFAARWWGRGGEGCRQKPCHRARLYPRPSANLGGDFDRRRSVDAVGAPDRRDRGKHCRHRPRQNHPHPHPRAGRGARADNRRNGAALRARNKATLIVLHANHPRELTNKPAPLARDGRCRNPDGLPIGAVALRQRRHRDARSADARLGRVPHQALLPASWRSRAGHGASAHQPWRGARV